MKKLFDGTLVSANTPTKITNRGREMLSPEEINEMITEQEKTQSQSRPSEILTELQQIDLRSIRSLRAGEVERLAVLETQAQALRDELAYLSE